MSRRWVADASPIILLAKAGRPGLLSAPAQDLLVPKVVAEEIRQGPPEDPAREWLEEVGERFVEATNPVEPEIAAWDLGQGESRVLSSACRREGWTAVVDDGAARRCAQGLGVPTVGTLGVLVVAKKEGRLDKVEPAIEQLRRAGLHVGDAVVEQILRMAGES